MNEGEDATIYIMNNDAFSQYISFDLFAFFVLLVICTKKIAPPPPLHPATGEDGNQPFFFCSKNSLFARKQPIHHSFIPSLGEDQYIQRIATF
jgi:hypothetical protein